jgi:secondary thiamine-phosphate synthase enzyme
MIELRTTLLVVETKGRGFVDVTGDIRGLLAGADADNGLLALMMQHTSASLLVQENTDPDVRADLEDAFELVAPRARHYRHATEGADDMPAHIRAAILPFSVTIPVEQGLPLLGTWQAIYVVEHRDQPHRRTIAATYIGTLRAGG